MYPKDLSTKNFLKRFKSRDKLRNFLGQLQKRGIEKMLEGELDHLGYEKHSQSDNSKVCDGFRRCRVCHESKLVYVFEC